jgi:hypothetical protein
MLATRHTSISATIIFDARLPASVPSIILALKVIANVVAIALGTDHVGIPLTGLCGKHNTYWRYSLRLAWFSGCSALQQIWLRDFRFGSSSTFGGERSRGCFSSDSGRVAASQQTDGRPNTASQKGCRRAKCSIGKPPAYNSKT